MILDWIIHVFLAIQTTILSVFPTIPAAPSAITSATTWITDQIGTVTSVLRYIYGSTLFDAIIGVIALIWSFEIVYHSVMWVIRKIPFLGVH